MTKTINILLLILISVSAFAQDDNSRPQIAYRILTDYIADKEEQNRNGLKSGSIVSMIVGGTLLTGSAVMYFWGDDIIGAFSQEALADWTPETRDITCGSIALGGVVSLSAGVIMALTPPRDYREEFSLVLNEPDPVVQEALAAGALFDLSEKGRRGRVTSGIIDMTTPLISLGITIIFNVAEDRPWYEDNEYNFISFGVNLIKGLVQIIWEKSDEEQLYEKYLTAKETFLVDGPGDGNKLSFSF